MNRKVIAFLVALLVLGGARTSHATDPSLFLDYVGFDYEDPDPVPSSFGEAGSGYASVGEVPMLFAPLQPDTANFVYTYYIFGPVAVSQQLVGPFVIVNYAGGTLQVWEDAKVGGTTGTYGSNPPNASSPSTFADGTLFVEGALTNFQFVFSTASNSGSFEAEFTMTGGSQLVNVPANQRVGWTFAGATSNSLEIPQGYAHQVDGQIFLEKPVPAQGTSWGRLKANYR